MNRWRRTLLASLAVAHVHPMMSAADRPAGLGERYAAPAEVGREWIGSSAQEWTFDWLESEPLTLQQLRGKVVLVRWWTAPGCPYCSASADALNTWWRKYRDQGLTVIGAYHHKSDTPFTREHVREQAQQLGFSFRIAIDRDWATLERWWLKKQRRGWTSVTFLIDRAGTIRHVHPGGAYFKGEPGFDALEAALKRALEKPSH